MILYVCEDVIKSLGKPNDINQEHAIRIFNEISLALQRGKHYVLIENFLKESVNKTILDNSTAQGYLYFKKCNTSKSLSILKLINVVLVISFNGTKRVKSLNWYNDHTLLALNPSKDTNLEVFEETHLLTESLNDGKLFKAITLRHMKWLGLLNSISISFLNRNGGGITLSDVYNQEKEMNSHLCITIVDSDKKYHDGPEGKTASTFRSHKDEKWIFSDYHIMKELSEIENLLPTKFYEDRANKPLIRRLSHIDLSYFDLKCGLTADIVKADKGYNYWSNKGISMRPIEDIRELDDKHILIQGLGSQIMGKFLSRKKYQSDIIGIKHSDLSENQRNEYKAISNLVLNWCVCVNPPRL